MAGRSDYESTLCKYIIRKGIDERLDRDVLMSFNIYSNIVGLVAKFFFFQAEDGIRDYKVTGVQTCALPILRGTELRRLELQVARASERQTSALYDAVGRGGPAELQQDPCVLAVGSGIARYGDRKSVV